MSDSSIADEYPTQSLGGQYSRLGREGFYQATVSAETTGGRSRVSTSTVPEQSTGLSKERQSPAQSTGPSKRESSTVTRTVQGETVTSTVSPTKRDLGTTQGEVKEQPTSKPDQERVEPSSIQD